LPAEKNNEKKPKPRTIKEWVIKWHDFLTNRNDLSNQMFKDLASEALEELEAIIRSEGSKESVYNDRKTSSASFSDSSSSVGVR
jgi:hypothetical protein